MARTVVNVSKLALVDGITDVAESAVAIDQPNGMKVVVGSKVNRISLRVTNTSGAGKVVTIKAPAGAGNPRGQYGAPGPAGSYPAEPDFVTASIPATTGVRLFGISSRYMQSDGSVWVDFAAGHTGTIAAYESA